MTSINSPILIDGQRATVTEIVRGVSWFIGDLYRGPIVRARDEDGAQYRWVELEPVSGVGYIDERDVIRPARAARESAA
jgi:hypothetical protein